MALDEDASVEHHPLRKVADNRRDVALNVRVEPSRCAIEASRDKFNPQLPCLRIDIGETHNCKSADARADDDTGIWTRTQVSPQHIVNGHVDLIEPVLGEVFRPFCQEFDCGLVADFGVLPPV